MGAAALLAKAEEIKAKGNEFLKLKKFPEAIAWYTQAIEKDPAGHVYYSNRSAAHLANGDAGRALEDGTKVSALLCTFLSRHFFLLFHSPSPLPSSDAARGR